MLFFQLPPLSANGNLNYGERKIKVFKKEKKKKEIKKEKLIKKKERKKDKLIKKKERKKERKKET